MNKNSVHVQKESSQCGTTVYRIINTNDQYTQTFTCTSYLLLFYVCVHVYMYFTLTTDIGLSIALSGKAIFDSPTITVVSAAVVGVGGVPAGDGGVPAGDGVTAAGDYTR